jgi:hypothetical protein
MTCIDDLPVKAVTAGACFVAEVQRRALPSQSIDQLGDVGGLMLDGSVVPYLAPSPIFGDGYGNGGFVNV